MSRSSSAAGQALPPGKAAHSFNGWPGAMGASSSWCTTVPRDGVGEHDLDSVPEGIHDHPAHDGMVGIERVPGPGALLPTVSIA